MEPRLIWNKQKLIRRGAETGYAVLTYLPWVNYYIQQQLEEIGFGAAEVSGHLPKRGRQY